MLLHKSSLVANNVSMMDSLSSWYDRYSTVEPYIHAFLQEENLKTRLIHETHRLPDKFPYEKPAFYGIPVAIKDLIHVDGFPTRAGSRLPVGALTTGEGSFISKLRSMGALFAGKTVTEEFAYYSVTPTRNPHNLEHTPGGSSAGSAASVAAGICPMAVGTQTLRSVIAPASFCGVVGFKPSYARVALDGVILLSPSFDTIGLFTQDIDSMIYASSNLIPDWRSFHSDHKPVLGVPNGMYMNFMSDEVRRTFDNQLKVLEQLGYSVSYVDMPWKDDFIAGDAMIRMVQGEMAQVHETWFGQYEHLYGAPVREAIRNGQTVPLEELEQYRAGQMKLRHDLERTQMNHGIDLWISPAQGDTAPKGFDKTGWSGMTAIWSYAGLPTISIPVSTLGGMPLGLQCIGSHGEDEALLYWAKEIEHSIASE